MQTASQDLTLTAFVYQSHAAAQQLADTSFADKNQALLLIAKTIEEQRNQILEANTLDLEASREMAIPDLVLEWLKLTPERLQRTHEFLKQLAALPDPITNHVDQNGYRRVSLGTVAFVYEAFPLLGLMAAAMCLKVGNSIILKGGSEGSNSHAAISVIIQAAIKQCNLPEFSVMLAPEGSSIKELVTQEKYLRLVIPYGRPSFVQQICKQATVAVQPAAIGNCYLYLSPSGNLELASQVIKTSRNGDPDPVNAIDKVVVHRSWLEQNFIEWIADLQKQKMIVRGCDVIAAYCRNFSGNLAQEVTSESQWGQAYFDNTIAIKVVDHMDEAIAWINQYSSGHADVILTDSLQEARQFTRQVFSSNIFVNAISRFVRYGSIGKENSSSVALGMSSLKTRGASRYPGMIDLHALTMTKRIISS